MHPVDSQRQAAPWPSLVRSEVSVRSAGTRLEDVVDAWARTPDCSVEGCSPSYQAKLRHFGRKLLWSAQHCVNERHSWHNPLPADRTGSPAGRSCAEWAKRAQQAQTARRRVGVTDQLSQSFKCFDLDWPDSRGNPSVLQFSTSITSAAKKWMVETPCPKAWSPQSKRVILSGR